MNNFLIDPLKNLSSYSKILEDIKEDISPISTYGIIDENLSHIIYAIKEHTGRQTLLITYDELRGKKLYEDIIGYGYENVSLFPKREIMFYDVDASSYESSYERLKVMSELAVNKDMIIIVSLEALLDKVPTPLIFEKYTQKIDMETSIDLKSLVKNFIDAGYERVHMVEAVGQFSIRGGIIDFFPPNALNPYRVELFDTEVDSIRTFDFLTQRSIDMCDSVTIPPAKEIIIVDEYKDEILKNLEEDLKNSSANKRGKEKFNKHIGLLKENTYMSYRDMIIPYIPKEFIGSIFDFLKEDALVILDETKRIEKKAKDLQYNFSIKFADLLEAGEVLPAHMHIEYDYWNIIPKIKEKTILTNSTLLKGDASFRPKSIYNFSVKSMTKYHNKMEILKEDLDYYKYRGYKIIILMGSKERGIRLVETLEEFSVESTFVEDRSTEIKSNQIFITKGNIQGGYEYPALKLMVLSENEIFGVQKKSPRKKAKKSKNKTITLSDLNIGNFVVHENHGIGRYEGIEQLDIQGVIKDYLTIRYKGEDKLYVPIDQMNLIQKYIGADSIKPKVNKLNSGEWKRTKTRARAAVEDMAQDLLDLYAKRENIQGYSFSKDSLWQREFEDLFPYEETEGQLNSVIEIKKDMESSRPMERLLCGDVGFGKTEVALRGAFKALTDGKQVAILVPTTILAQQHYNTMMERFKDFPINVAMLSRFRTPKEQKMSIEGLKRGYVDIVVGTHRLLSKDIAFKDLGLLIIDEEQRFGVKHKEKLKQLKENVDVLTLTATPIPRTLHMSLVGVRDMSVIDEPPEDRYPIQTYVVEYNEEMIRDAILKEINRGGQVYFVYNRVETIDRMASKLRELVPEASFTVGHGQMGERELEKVMVDFFDKQQDVLVCTTIIETGLDIPNVNTIIIFDADKMGLSQLYQLRGRVGRSNRVAYGYFVYEKNKVLTEVAEKRLQSIKEFTEFGSGFKIAMRDLEIRGAGNLLGLQQHGHIESIGYDLYVKFLGESIRKLKGEVVEEVVDTAIDISVDGYIPSDFILDEEQKIEVYKKIATVEDLEDYRELIDELIDRFGDIPIEVENLMDISYIKSLASKNNINNISEVRGDIKLELVNTDSLSINLIDDLNTTYGRRISFDLSSTPYINFKPREDLLKELIALNEKINSFTFE